MKKNEIAEESAREAGRYDALGDVVLAEQAWRTVETVGYPVPKKYCEIRRAECRARTELGGVS